jgi:acetyl esterase/lipase
MDSTMPTPAEYQRLLRLLETRTFTMEIKGLRIEMKPVPDAERDGDLDPRVFSVMGDQKVGSLFGERSPSAPFDPRALDLRKIRASMGWPNIDVTSGEILSEERTIPGTERNIPIRIYFPKAAGARPAVLFFHGGGFIGGTVDVVENGCKALSNKAGAVVVSVDYRLAPEHTFPAGLTDCFDAVTWVHGRAKELDIAPGGLIVAGDSAGGNLAAACAIRDRDAKSNMIALQALIYPTVDLACKPCAEYTWDLADYSIRNNRELIQSMISMLRADEGLLHQVYLHGNDPAEPLVSPLYLPDAVGLAPALILTAEYDALRLEAEAFARKLARASVKTRLIRYCGMDHAFVDKIGLYPQAEDCMNEIAREIRGLGR